MEHCIRSRQHSSDVEWTSLFQGLTCTYILGAQAIATILLLCCESFNDVDTVALQRTLCDLIHENIPIEEALATSEVLKVSDILERAIAEARGFGRTSNLWIQHFGLEFGQIYDD